LQDVPHAIHERSGRKSTYFSGGVVFVAGGDPDGIQVLVAHPSLE
jgi:hypothetical protein